MAPYVPSRGQMTIPNTTPDLANFTKAASLHNVSQNSPFWAGNLAHLYLQLSIKLDLEGATSVQEAERAHSYIRKAADAAYLTAKTFGGDVLEIHGRTIHLGLEYGTEEEGYEKIFRASGLLHVLLEAAYAGGGPDGWRISADQGFTITVTSPGIHDDTSLVSLSPAANFPAKQLGKKQVPLRHLGFKHKGTWRTDDLDTVAKTCASAELAKDEQFGATSLNEQVMEKRAQAFNFSARTLITASADPLGAPTTDNPYSCFGFVLSFDLDGFTKRVEKASGSIEDQKKLAFDFFKIMQESAKFAEEHPEWFIQFPFAGDNAIFAVTAEGIGDYRALKRLEVVSIALEWERKMGVPARVAGYGGWGQSCSGGGTPHGNSKGNLHVAGILMEGRRFLVGIGPGMRYARQAFTHVDPTPKEMAMHKEDVSELQQLLAKDFNDCPSKLGETSSYYKMAKLTDLEISVQQVKAEQTKLTAVAAVSAIPLTGVSIIHRPHCGSK